MPMPQYAQPEMPQAHQQIPPMQRQQPTQQVPQMQPMQVGQSQQPVPVQMGGMPVMQQPNQVPVGMPGADPSKVLGADGKPQVAQHPMQLASQFQQMYQMPQQDDMQQQMPMGVAPRPVAQPQQGVPGQPPQSAYVPPQQQQPQQQQPHQQQSQQAMQQQQQQRPPPTSGCKTPSAMRDKDCLSLLKESAEYDLTRKRNDHVLQKFLASEDKCSPAEEVFREICSPPGITGTPSLTSAKIVKAYLQRFERKDEAPKICEELENVFKRYYTSTDVLDWYTNVEDLQLGWLTDKPLVSCGTCKNNKIPLPPGGCSVHGEDHTRRAQRIASDLQKASVLQEVRDHSTTVMLLDGKGRIVWLIIHYLKTKHHWSDAAINNLRFILPDVNEDMCHYHALGIPMCIAIKINICHLLEVMAQCKNVPRIDVLYLNFSQVSPDFPEHSIIGKRKAHPENAPELFECLCAQVKWYSNYNKNMCAYLSMATNRGAAGNIAKLAQYFTLEGADAGGTPEASTREGRYDEYVREVLGSRERAINALLYVLGNPETQFLQGLERAFIRKIAVTQRANFLSFAIRPRESECIVPIAILSDLNVSSPLSSVFFPDLSANSSSILTTLLMVVDMILASRSTRQGGFRVEENPPLPSPVYMGMGHGYPQPL